MQAFASHSRFLQMVLLVVALAACGGGATDQTTKSSPQGLGRSNGPGPAIAPVQIGTTTVVAVNGDQALLRLDLPGDVPVASAPSDAKKRRAAAPPTGGTPIVVDPNRRVRLIGYVIYNTLSCQFIEGGTFSVVSTTPVSPAHGAVDSGTIINFTLGSGGCAGTTLPFTNAQYTWTDDAAPTATADPFTLHFVSTSGGTVADTDWRPTVRQLPEDPDKGHGGCLADDPRTCSCLGQPCNEAGNPAMVSKGHKFQEEFDFAAAAHTGISLTRYYNSDDTRVSGFGRGWRSSWERSLAIVPGGPLKFTREDGRIVKFLAISSTPNYSSDPDVVSRMVAEPAGGWRVTRADDSMERYSADGRLQTITSRSGRVTALTYDGSGRLTTVTGPFGHTLRFAYTGALITQATGPDGRAYVYGYDALNNLTSVTYPDSAVRRYVYENPVLPNSMTGIVDELGVRFATYTYDQSARVISTQHAGGAELTMIAYNPDATSTVTDARGFVHSRNFVVQHGLARPLALTGAIYPRAGGAVFTYDANGFLATRTDWNGNVTSYEHDARGNETSRTDATATAVARSTVTRWLANFNLPSQIDEPTKSMTFTYDANGNRLTRTETAGGLSRTWAYTYNAVGDVLTSTDPNGQTTSFAYDAQGALTRVTNALGHVTQITGRDGNGRPTRMVDPNGLVTTMSYDARGRLLTQNFGGLVTAFTYNAIGKPLTVTRPDGSRLTMAYDAAQRLVRVTDSLGNFIAYTLDANGNRTNVSVFNASGALSRSVSYAYDEANRVIRSTGALGQVTAFTRDGNGNVLTQTDPVGARTRVQYDALNRPVQSVDALGGVTDMVYDPVDRLLSLTDPRRLTTSYQYNGFGDLLQIDSPDSGTTLRTFDAVGNLLTSTDARGQLNSRTYDALNRLINIAYIGGFQSYQYDSGSNGIGRLTQVSGVTDTTQLSYDLLGRLTGKQQTVGTSSLTQTYGYNPAGQLVTVTYPSGMRVGYQFDAAGQVAALTVDGTAFLSSIAHEPFGPAKGWTWGTQTYSRPHDTDGRVTSYPLGAATRTLRYDAASRIIGYTDSTGPTQTFGYDLLERLTSYASPSLTQTYTYDADGNRTSLANGTVTTTYGISASSNALLSQVNPTASYVYDAAGNLVANRSLSFSYDALGRMTGSTVNGLKSGRTLYVTNGLGQRVRKAGPVTATTFLYGSGSQLMGEYAATSSQESIYLDGMPVGLNNNGTLLRVYSDQLGAQRQVSTSAGATQWIWDGDPFGDVAPSGPLAFNMRFPGQYADSETGLYFNHARYYDPKVGRFTQSDPIGLSGGLNMFNYADSNPVGEFDSPGTAATSYANIQASYSGAKKIKDVSDILFDDSLGLGEKYFKTMNKICSNLPLAAYDGLCKALKYEEKGVDFVRCHADFIADVWYQIWHLNEEPVSTQDWQYQHAHDVIYYAPRPIHDPNRGPPSLYRSPTQCSLLPHRFGQCE